MRLIYSAFAASLLLTTGAFADGTCSASQAAATGEKASCAAACAEKATMAKGGAADSNTVSGYQLGQKVPDFTSVDSTGKEFKLSDHAGKTVVLVFYNQGCPYVVEVKDRLSEFTTKYADKGVAVVAVDSGISNSKEAIAEHDATVPYTILVNNDSTIARNFEATRTPEVFVLNKDGVVSYTGAFDNGEKGVKEGAVKTFTEDAVKALLAGQEPEVKQTKAFGCSIKFAPKS
jgi:peroxiredoxin